MHKNTVIRYKNVENPTFALQKIFSSPTICNNKNIKLINI